MVKGNAGRPVSHSLSSRGIPHSTFGQANLGLIPSRVTNVKPKMAVRPPTIRKLGEIPLKGRKVDILEVDGDKVRDKYWVDFIGGGHSEVYPKLVPKHQIWVERMADKDDEATTLMHEMIEYILMAIGGKDYETAHTLTNHFETAVRKIL